MLLRTYEVSYDGCTMKEVVRTKKAWVNFYRRHRDYCVYVVPAGQQFFGDEISMKPRDFVNSLINDGILEVVK